jgi:hypothetical protein
VNVSRRSSTSEAIVVAIVDDENAIQKAAVVNELRLAIAVPDDGAPGVPCAPPARRAETRGRRRRSPLPPLEETHRPAGRRNLAAHRVRFNAAGAARCRDEPYGIRWLLAHPRARKRARGGAFEPKQGRLRAGTSPGREKSRYRASSRAAARATRRCASVFLTTSTCGSSGCVAIMVS